MRLLFLLLVCAVPVWSAVAGPPPAGFALDGSLTEWKSRPRTLGTPDAPVWLARAEGGLVIAARIPRDGAFEVRLALMDEPLLPELPYDEDSCIDDSGGDAARKADCLRWVKAQNTYRERLLRQFRRCWRIARTGSQEVDALPAFDAFTPAERAAVRFPRPDRQPQFRFGADGVEVLIPWSIFPPASSLTVDRVAIQIGAVSDSVALEPPVVAHLSRCDQPLTIRDLHGAPQPAYYFLEDARGVVGKAFFVDNPQRPEMGLLPEPDDLSPLIRWESFFSRELTPGEYVCGPNLSYRKGEDVRHYGLQLGPGYWAQWALDTHRTPEGAWLIRALVEGLAHPLLPKTMLYTGTTIFTLAPDGRADEALRLGEWSDTEPAYRIELSPDWKTVREMRREPRSYCWDGRLYQMCGSR